MENSGGKHTMHEVTMNNGLRLYNLHLAAQWYMIIAITKFKQKIEHKSTWIMSVKPVGNQTDYV